MPDRYVAAQAFASPADALAHYGVKGMKWGVRKEAKKNFRELSIEVNQRQENRRLNSTLTEKAFSKLDDKDVVILKGSELRRVTQNPGFDRENDRLYVSTNAEDANSYRALFPYDKQVANYEVTYKATQNLTSPSEKTRVEAYIKLMGTPDIPTTDGRVINGREYLREAGLGDVVNGLSDRQLALTYYGQLVSFQGMRDEPIGSAYFRELSRRGYNAMVDDNDRNILSSQPLLTFDARKTLEQIGTEIVTKEAQTEARAKMRLPERGDF